MQHRQLQTVLLNSVMVYCAHACETGCELYRVKYQVSSEHHGSNNQAVQCRIGHLVICKAPMPENTINLAAGGSLTVLSLSNNLGRIHVNGGWPRQLLPLLVKA